MGQNLKEKDYIRPMVLEFQPQSSGYFGPEGRQNVMWWEVWQRPFSHEDGKQRKAAGRGQIDSKKAGLHQPTSSNQSVFHSSATFTLSTLKNLNINEVRTLKQLV